jgi:drug/metabolite transporter (DMT)-like permease
MQSGETLVSNGAAGDQAPRLTRRTPSAVIGCLCVGASALLFAISANMGRALFLGHFRLFGSIVPPISPLMIAQSRSSIAALLMFPAVWLVQGRRSIHLKRSELRDCMLVGVFGIAASNYYYYLSIKHIGVATAITLEYLAPVFVLLWMLFRKLQKPTFFRIGGVVVAVLGTVLAIGIVNHTSGFPWLAVVPGQLRFDFIGVSAALIAAVALAFYAVFASHLIQSHDSWIILAWSLVGSAVCWLFVNPPWSIVAAHYTGPQWIFMAIFSIVSIMVPFSFYFYGLKHLDATSAIVTSCLQPVFSILIAALVLGEMMGGVQIVGMALVLASTVLVQIDAQPAGRPSPFEPME